MRVKVTPINPNTVYQSRQRTYMSNIAKAWASTLTDAQRQSWTAFGETVGTMSIFGNKLILSGIAIFQRLNRLILAAGGTMITSPPVALNVTGLTSVTLAANHVGPILTITFTPTPYAGTQGLYVYATPALSPGITNIRNKIRLLKFYAAAASPLDIHTDWVARFGAFPGVAGQRIAVAVHAMDNATGALTPSTVASAIVT